MRAENARLRFQCGSAKRSGAALRKREELFRLAVDSLPDGLAICDAERRYTFMNAEGLRRLGMPLESVVGRRVEDLYDQQTTNSFLPTLTRAYETGRTQIVECALNMSAGRFELVLKFVPMLKAGRVYQVLNLAFDITERKRAESELLRLASFPERNPDPIVEIDCAGQVVYLNPAAELLFPDISALGLAHPWLDDWVSVQRAFRDDHDRAYARDLAVGEVWYHQLIHCLGLEGPIRVYGHDITERKRGEQALLEADRQKNRFLALLSHELRNPLMPIKNSLFVLNRAPPGGAQVVRAKAVIERQTAHLARLVDDLLDVTRIVSGKLRLQRSRFDLAQMLRRTADDHLGLFSDASIALEVRIGDEPVWIDGDPSRLTQAVGNLLANAIKFTEPGGRVALALEQDPSSRIGTILVSDTGVGLPSELLATIFEPFMQVDRTLDRSKGGLGVGLALVKGVIEAHGGTVEALSDGLGRGADFVVRLPAEVEAGVPVGDAERPSRHPSRRVLIIEDNVDAADSLREALELGDHQAEVAYNGPDGIKLAQEFKPDVVLCDIGLPGMSGYEVARALRADQSLHLLQLVALTGYAQPDDQQRATAAGFNGHIAKPSSIEQIEEVLSRAGKGAG